ncbi:PucR family transcriptional regulator ligand-binding domain-containing protein [Nocardioidaceae bacterium SCSIO 66511]|nr:PucR family transcriptional regulator ligand-binding domain-containing protein [Nocardioidaceae bacterium SCSIO 66511]
MVSLANTVGLEVQQLITATYGVPLSDVLDVECLAGTTVLAGSSGLGRSVTRVNVMEVPDVVDWVKPHELLVTTAFSIVSSVPDEQARSEAFVRLVRDLRARDVAALGVKLGRYLDAVPPEAVAAAEEVGLPLLSLPADLAYDDLLQQVHARLNEVQTGVLERIDALHTALTHLVLEGGDLEQIAAEVARVLAVGVLFCSTDGRERAAAMPDEMREALAAADLFDPTGRFRVERASRRPLPVGDGQVRLQPVVAGGSDLARMVCFTPDREPTADDVYALERAATVAALLITRQQAVTAVESKYRGDFLRDVFVGRAGDPEYVVEHAAALGWKLDRPMLVVSAELDPPGADEPVSSRVRRSWQERFFAAWRQVTETYDKTVPTVEFSAEVVTLLPVPEYADDPERAYADARSALSRLVTEVAGDKGGGRRPFSVGVSRVVRSIDRLQDGYAQARRATEVGRRMNGGGSTTHFDQLGIHRLIALIPDDHELGAFAGEVLGELAADTDDARDLRTTLQILLDTNLNVAEAARLQFFHYNTMRYRISKLERILGPFSTDPHLRLNIAVALQVLEVRG